MCAELNIYQQYKVYLSSSGVNIFLCIFYNIPVLLHSINTCTEIHKITTHWPCFNERRHIFYVVETVIVFLTYNIGVTPSNAGAAEVI